MAKKIKGAGTLLQAYISGSYTTVAQRVKVEGPDGSNELVDTSDLDSTAVERNPTIPDGGDVTLSIWFDPNESTHTQLETWRTSPPSTAPLFQVVFPTSPSKKVQFGAWVSAFKPTGMEVKGYLQADVTLSITGAITWV